MSPSGPDQRRPVGRTLAAIAAAVVGFYATGTLVIAAMEAGGVPYLQVELEVTTALDERLHRPQMKRRTRPLLTYIGDSLGYSRDGSSTPWELRKLLQTRKTGHRPIHVQAVSVPGLTDFSVYLASERIAGIGADYYMIGLNLRWFARGRRLQQPSLGGFLPVGRWLEAAGLPLHRIGLSAAEVLAARAIISSGHLFTWHQVQREQVRVRNALDIAERHVQSILGDPRGARYKSRISGHLRARAARRGRPTLEHARATLGPMLGGLDDDNPNLRTLAAAVRRLRETDARVLIYAFPINVDRLEVLDLYDDSQIDASLGQIRKTIENAGGEFLDLHAILPDDSFRDKNGHLAHDAASVPARRIAARLARWVHEGAPVKGP